MSEDQFKLRQYAEVVKRMRDAQNVYYARPDKSKVVELRTLQREVDEMTTTILLPELPDPPELPDDDVSEIHNIEEYPPPI